MFMILICMMMMKIVMMSKHCVVLTCIWEKESVNGREESIEKRNGTSFLRVLACEVYYYSIKS